MNVFNTKIKFTASTIAWTEGGRMSMNIKARAGSAVSIAWGDSKTTAHLFYNEAEVSFRHDYYPKYNSPPREYDGTMFHVEINSYHPDCLITGFYLAPVDMDAIDLDVTNCPELEKLTYCGYCQIKPRGLDLSRNSALKYLDCSDNEFTSLDLSNNTALEEVYCRRNRLKHLSLTNNYALKSLNCEYNEMEQIFLFYAPQLRDVEFVEGNNLDEATIIAIQELVADNN